MKWYDNSYNNIKIDKISHRLLKVNEQVYDSIFERDGKYILFKKCGITTYSLNHNYTNFVTDGFKMIYELPPEQQEEIELDFEVANFLQENKTIISSLPGSEISLNADINTEYIAHRELNKSIMIKYDDDNIKDLPMDKRNYNEDIVVERLINNTKEPIGYQKEDKYYFDIKENRDYIKVIEDGVIVNDEFQIDGDSIELPSELGTDIAWQSIEGNNIVIENTSEKEPLKLVEIWGDTNQKSSYCITHEQLVDCIGKSNSSLNSDGTFSVKWPSLAPLNYGSVNKNHFIQLEPDTLYSMECWNGNNIPTSNIGYILFEETRTIDFTGKGTMFTTGKSGKVFLYPLNVANQRIKILVMKGEHQLKDCSYNAFNPSEIEHIGELYTDSRGRSILNREGNEQYKIEINSGKDYTIIPYSNLINSIDINYWTAFTIPRLPIGEIEIEIISYKTRDVRICLCAGENTVLKLINTHETGKFKIQITDNSKEFYLMFHSNNIQQGNLGNLFTEHLGITFDIIIKCDGLKKYALTKHKTTILLPCQLSKVGDIADKLYWDEENNKYIVEKKVEYVLPKHLSIGSFETRTNANRIIIYNTIPLQYNNGQNFNNRTVQYLNYKVNDWAGKDILGGVSTSWEGHIYLTPAIKYNTQEEAQNWLNTLLDIKIGFIRNNTKRIETTILEQKTLNCYNDRTYVTINNTNLSPIIKVKTPININTSNQIFLPRENNFDSILNVTLEPNKNTNITFFEGGLNLKLANGIEILSTGEAKVSNKDGCYASKDFINLAAYTSSTFTIDVMDLLFDVDRNHFSIFYYNKDKNFIAKELIAFGGKFYKSNIKYPSNTQYCKIAFINKLDITSDFYKIRILRDTTKKNGFKTITKALNNDNNYTKSFSELVSIKDHIERLVFFTDNYTSINELSIINNFDKNQKIHSYRIPKLLEPDETLSYTKAGKKQFLYNSKNIPYNSITNANYTRPYREYSNIADNVKFILFKNLQDNNDNLVNANEYCATEKYINISAYQGKMITLSVASLMKKSIIIFYNEQKRFIKRVAADNNFVNTVIPNDAHYIRCASYLQTLGAQTAETKELIQKHVMITLTGFRCDFVPYGVKHSHTIIPEELEVNKYELILNNDNKYLFIEPYHFDYTIKDMNSISTNGTNGSEKWALDLFTKEGINGNHATLDTIKNKTPYSSSVIANPTWSMSGKENTILVFTKYIQTSDDFTLTVHMSIDDWGSVYLNDNHINNYSYGGNQRIELPLQQGMNKLVVLIVNDGGGGGVTVSPEITTSSHNNIVSVGDQCNYNTITIENKFNIDKFFAHDIVNGKLLTPKEDNIKLRIDSSSNDKFIFAKDFVSNSDRMCNGYINANAIKEASNSKTYINRVYGGETNLTLLTVGGNVCEVYFLNDYAIDDKSHYVLYAKYASGNQKIKIDKIPDNTRYIAVVTDKENEHENTKCSNIFLFPGDLTRSIDTSCSHFEMLDDFTQEIATIPYSSEIVSRKNKLPTLSKLILDSSKYFYDEDSNRFIFPIKIEQDSAYYLQYWTETPNQLLNVFVDSVKEISDTRQYLCRHTDVEIANNKTIQINSDILARLIDNTLYLSVSLNNSNRLNIHEFLLRGTYKFQLEKDSITQEYEPYEEIVKHHPMYLTANGLTIESTSSYYGIRELEVPKNVTSTYDNGVTTITWDTVIGATHYILYLDNKALQTVYTSSYTTMDEIKGMVTVKAINSVAESKLSDAILVHSVPSNPYIIYIDNKYEDDEYKFDVHFQDKSDIETGYRVRYKIDTREEKIIDLEPAPGIDSIIRTNFSATAIQDKVVVRITAKNDKGENEVASQFTLKLMPEFVWTYNADNHKIVMAWDNTFSEEECTHYVIRYKKKSEEIINTIKLPNNYSGSPRIKYSIDLDPEDEMELSLSALKNDIYYIFTKPKKVSKDLDITKIPPSNFRSSKIENNIVEFSWIDNSLLETGWELVYSINNGSSTTIKIPTKSQTADKQLYKYRYTFTDHGFMTAKLRTIWELGASDFTESITNYYYPIINETPKGLKKQYESKNSMLITWDPQMYFESYEIVITKKDGTQTIKTKDNRYIINLNDKVIEEYKVKVRTNFLGDQHSNYTDEITFTPTFSDNKLMTTINTNHKEEYVVIRKKTNEIRDEFDIATRSTSKVSWSFPLMTATLNRFQTYEGLLSMETWNTGQRTEYTDTMIIKTANVNMHEAIINTISYQKTECEGCFKAFVYTPSTISGKIVMEINKTRIVCIGDSITAGHPGFWAESMTGEITHQYPYWLDRRLKFQYEVINKGYGSDRTFNVLNRFQKDVLDLSPQYCLMQIGTNDIYWGGASADGSIEAFESSTLADMKKNVMTMVELCFQNNIVPIIGMLIPRTQVVTDPVVKHGLYKFNEWIIEYANSTEGLNYVDFFNAGKDKIPATPLEDPKSPGAMNPIYDGDNVYDEMGNLVKYGAGIHLNAAGYRIMAEAIPLNLFTTIQSGVKMYMDEKCTIEADYNIEDKQNPFYEIEIEGMKLTRTKKIVRYIKNIGNTQVLFSIYPNDLHNLDYNFKFKDTDEGTKTISGILTPGNSRAIKMEMTPLTEDSKSSIELSLVSREFSIETK